LVVELSEDAHWFWNAQKDWHGTTANKLILANPTRWKQIVKNDPERGQWTNVQTIPARVAEASIRYDVHKVY
jgi:hypothetical protein